MSTLSMLSERELRRASVALAARYFGAKGRFAYEAFAYLNRAYFADALPWPLILWGLTPHGACLARVRLDADAPVIQLHPSLLGGSERANPWGVPATALGPAFACDALLHECIHLAVGIRRDGASGPTAHNSPAWIAEVNRLAPPLGLGRFVAGRSATARVSDPDAPAGPRGRPRTVVRRVSEATIDGEPAPFGAVAGFPHVARRLLGGIGYYAERSLPFRHALEAAPAMGGRPTMPRDDAAHPNEARRR